MKFLKILGLAAVAAAALTALLGAGSASATVLCTEPGVKNVCPAGKKITTLEGSQIGSAELETTGGALLDTCAGAHLHGTVTSDGAGKPASGPIEKLEWTECTRTTDTISLGTLSASQVGTKDEATISGSGSSVTVNGIFSTSCQYGTGTSTPLGTMTGGKNARLKINALVPRTAPNFLCPAETRWTAEFQVTNHSEVHITDS